MLRQTRKWACYNAVLLVAVGGAHGNVMANMLVNTASSGSLLYSYRNMNNTNTNISQQQHLLGINTRNSFYIWQSWMATGNADLTFSQGKSIAASTTQDNQQITGSIGLNLLPLSRFPMNINLTRSDSSVSREYEGLENHEIDSSDYIVTETASVTQSLIGKNTRTQFAHTERNQISNKRGEFGSSQSGLSHIWRESGKDARLEYTVKNERSYSGVERGNENGLIRFAHYTNPQITFNTHASHSSVLQRQESEDELVGYEYATNYGQFFTSAMWRSKDANTRLNVASRMHVVELIRDGLSRQNELMSNEVGLSHRFTPNLTGNANVSHTHSQNSEDDDVFTSSNNRLGMRYNSNQISLGKFDYRWSGGIDYAQRYEQVGKLTDSSYNLGHSLGRAWVMGVGSRLNANLSQDYSHGVKNGPDGSDDVRRNLGHRVALSWSQASPGVNRQLQLSATDRRELSSVGVARVYDARYTQTNTLTMRSSLNTTLSYQETYYQYDASAGSDTSSTNGTLMYRYLGPFSIPGLMFTSDITYSLYATSSEHLATNNQTRKNRLVYKVGKLESSLEHQFRESNNSGSSMYLLNLKRDL